MVKLKKINSNDQYMRMGLVQTPTTTYGPLVFPFLRFEHPFFIKIKVM